MSDPTGPDGLDVDIGPPGSDLGPGVVKRLEAELAVCPDVAFAHLARVTVGGRADQAELGLFVWLVPEAVGSLRPALNLVSEAVARALPDGRYVDVLILNSAPDLLGPVATAGTLVVVRDPDEHRRAVAAAAGESSDAVTPD